MRLAVKALQIMVAETMNVTTALTNVSTTVASVMACPMQSNRVAVSVLSLYSLRRLVIIAHCLHCKNEKHRDTVSIKFGSIRFSFF